MLTTAQELLRNGLLGLLQEVRAGSLRSDQLVSVVTTALTEQLPHLHSVFNRIFEEMSRSPASSSGALTHANLTAVRWKSPLQAKLRHCKVDGDSSRGRAIMCTHGAGAGIQLLSEPPLVFTASLQCGCRWDCFLVEHLRMATSLAASPSPSLVEETRLKLFSGLPDAGEQKEHQTVWPLAFRCLLATSSVVYCLACP
ncbi:hypothetical protein EON64_14775, partial [archaeon]